eukprot:gb/GFBE01070207.1/.p1 GENE.gb/GFBE01070207.1/~~gb/GFBE01070207.1/.p1  ORF type:complete len:277 (+),score=58.38 gb/GFBE01070207.1/:1-831(+)
MIFVEVPRDLPLRIFHRLGTNQFVVSIQLWAGDDVQTRVFEFFRQGQLPCCFYRQTLEYAALAVREALCDEQSEGPLPSVTLPSQGTARLPRPAVDVATDRLLSQVFEVGAFESRLRTLQSCAILPPESKPWGPQLQQVAAGDEVTFWCAYDFLLRHRPSFFRTIGTLEESYLKGIRDLVLGRAAAISDLQRCQSMEMEKVRQQAEESTVLERVEDEGLSRDVQVLVGQHVSEIDALELHWQTEIEQLKVRQKASYRDLVVDFFPAGDGAAEASGA